MNHSKLLLLLTLMIGGGNVAHSQTDVTSQYLVNANFEGSYTAYAHPNGGTTAIYQPDGWDIAYSNGNSSDVTALNKKDPGYSSSFGKVEKLTTGGKNTYLVYFYSGTKQTLTLSQEAVLPAGHYTVTADVFFTGQYSTSSFSVGEQVWNIELVAGTADGGIWKKASLSFTLDEETTVPFTYTISHPKKNKTVGGIDNITITYTSPLAYAKNELKEAIANATAANTLLGSTKVTAAIATAQGVYDDETVTENAVTAAMDALKSTVGNAMKGLPDGDVTAAFLTNYDFEAAPITFTNGSKNAEAERIGSTTKDGWVYTIPGWTFVAPTRADDMQIATATYGGSYSAKSQGLGGTNPPAADNDGNPGAGLHITAPWNRRAELTQQSHYTLPAGVYKLTYHVYNANSKTPIYENYTGVVVDGTATYGTKKKVTYKKWESDSVTFTLTEPKDVTFCLGFITAYGDASKYAKLYVDNLQLTYTAFADKTALQAAIDRATTVNATVGSDAVATAIADAQAVCDNDVATRAEGNAAMTALGQAVDAAFSDTYTVDLTYQLNGLAKASTYWEHDCSGQHWSGDTDRAYWDYRNNDNDNAWDYWNYETTTLPAGKYGLRFAGRASENTIKALVYVKYGSERHEADLVRGDGTGKGIDTDGNINYGDGTFANSGKGYGWQWYYVLFALDEPTEVEISVNGEGADNKPWMDVADMSLFAAAESASDGLELSDKATDAPATGIFKTVTYGDRTLYSGWNSIVLPFDATLAELGDEAEKAYSFAGTTKVEGKDNSYIINLATVDDGILKADTPYIVKMTADKDGLAFGGKIIVDNNGLTATDETNDAFSFQGTYVAYDGQAADNPIVWGDYIVDEEGFVKAAGSNQIGAFRAWLDNADPAGNAKIGGFTIDGGEVTGIEEVALRSAFTGKAYNLQGQQVRNPRHGVFIINGRKVVLK